jgi:hypothetical protein
MAKRMTETEKWKDPWFSNLTNDERIAWLYLLDDCDNAGVWQFNIRALNFNCNTNFKEDELISIFSERFVKISSDRFFIIKFCEYQYGIDFLKKNSKPILSAIDKLKKYNLVKENDKGNYTISIPLPNPYLTTKEQEQDKAKETDKAKDKDKDMVKDHILTVQGNWENNILEKLKA